jgi:integration host factor subunit alpha
VATTKADILEAHQSQLYLPKSQISDIIASLLEIMKKTLASGEDVLISNFDKFCGNEERERRGCNPATGKGSDV